MKTIIKSALLLIAAVIGVAVTSCNSNSEPVDTKTNQKFYKCYAVITDLQSGDIEICTTITISLDLNWTTGVAETDITGLSIGGKSYPQVSMTDITWGGDVDGWALAQSKTPTMVTSESGITPSVTDFSLRWVDRLDFVPVAGVYDPGCNYSFIIDNRYHVIGSRQPFVFAGSTKTKDADGNEYETLKPVYAIGLDFEKNTADIVIKNARFNEGMPHLTMRFNDVPFSIKDGGTRFELEKESLIPSIGDAPQSNYPISDLRGSIIPGSGMTLNFTCDFRKSALYDVSVNVDYTNYGEVLKDY